MVRTVAYNLIQLLFVIGFGPLYAGVLSRLKEIIQMLNRSVEPLANASVTTAIAWPRPPVAGTGDPPHQFPRAAGEWQCGNAPRPSDGCPP